ncbi:hypothetical protein BC936DRAFT_142314 [Jimgerdemannia flammicorona]|uniref:Uncharacterized protein n=1 Tax=Jimgerdemannia flammicorona TaxID=994334 RepID=A0A433A0P1_9FUNG|nr:hypothetical protein BC936DRAFT_142314 [Jimgerdemannia flammicorona]
MANGIVVDRRICNRDDAYAAEYKNANSKYNHVAVLPEAVAGSSTAETKVRHKLSYRNGCRGDRG